MSQAEYSVLKRKAKEERFKARTSLVLDRRMGRAGHPPFTPLLNNGFSVNRQAPAVIHHVGRHLREMSVSFLRTTASLRRAWACHKLPPGLMENHKSGSSAGKPEGRKNPGPPSYEAAGATELPFLMEFGRYGHGSQVVTPA